MESPRPCDTCWPVSIAEAQQKADATWVGCADPATPTARGGPMPGTCGQTLVATGAGYG